MSIEIPLTQGKFAIVDDDDEWIGKWKWYYSTHRGGRAERCFRTAGKRNTLFMHRVILDAPDGLQVDHINHDGLDNRRSNLRLCTNAQNNMNRTKLEGCSSKYKGVSWHRQKMKWQARITLNGKLKHLGWFSSEEEAARAYDKAAKEHFGDFAKINKE